MYYNGKESPTEPMQSLGVRLRLERERQKIGIGTIAEDTCISQRYIEAIEADDQTSLPGEFFYRAFVRQYSKYLGWDPDEVERQINMVSSLPNSEPVETAAGASSSISYSKKPADEQQVAALRETLKDMPIRAPQDDGMSKAWLVFAAVVIVGCVTYFMWPSLMGKPVETVPVAVVTPTPAPVVPPVVESPKQQTADPLTVNAQGAKKPEVSTIAPPTKVVGVGQFALTIRAKKMTWIRLTADGTKVYGGTLDAGQERTLNAKDAELIVGNAGTLDVIYNGKVLSYGSMGEVKTLLMKPDGWKYKPKPLPEPGSATSAAPSTGNSVNNR